MKQVPTAFHRWTSSLLINIPGVLVYLDSILIFGADQASPDSALREVLEILSATGAQLNAGKCTFSRSQMEFVGHLVDSFGSKPTEDRVAAVKQWARPLTTKDIARLLGFVGYMRGWIPNFADLAAPLQKASNATTFEWTRDAARAFGRIKNAASSSSVVAPYNDAPAVIMQTDASGVAWGVQLSQASPTGLRPVAWFSGTFSVAEQRWETRDRELFAVVAGLQKARFARGNWIVVVTDHATLANFARMRLDKYNRLARWAASLMQFNLSWEYGPGAANAQADALSRPDVPAAPTGLVFPDLRPSAFALSSVATAPSVDQKVLVKV